MLHRRLGDAIDGADLHRIDGGRGAAVRERGNHNDRQRPQPHHLLEEIEPVHLRHLDIERHDIRIERLDGLARLQRIGRLADDLNGGIGGERDADQRAHGRRIVDDENSDGLHLRSAPDLR